MAAAEEAREEAGVLGSVLAESIGSYTYCKRLRPGRSLSASTFTLEVSEELASWPEQDQRERAWFELPDAIAKVDEPELRDLLRQVR